MRRTASGLWMPELFHATVDQGGGGGRAGLLTENDNYALDKPYDLSSVTPEQAIAQIDEMLSQLYMGLRRAKAALAATGTGNVVGPASSVDGDVAMFSGTTGKLLADGAKLVSDLVTGPASAASGGIAQFSGTSGKVISDGGSFATILAGVGFVIGTLKLNTSQLDTLNATPITIVPAQGGNKQLFLVGAGTLTTRSAAWSASPSYRFQYNGSTTRLTTADLGSLLAAAGAGSATSFAPAANATTISAAFTNTAIEVAFSVDTNPGAATGTAWLVAVCGVVDAS